MELTLRREESAACQELLSDAAAHKIRLLLPAFCLLEPSFAIRAQGKRRRNLADQVVSDANEIARSTEFEETGQQIRELMKLLGNSENTERQALFETVAALVDAVEVIPLTNHIVDRAIKTLVPQYGLEFEDAVVLASIFRDREADSSETACFVTRDSDFTDPDIDSALAALNCKIVFKFAHCVAYVRH